MKSVYRTAAGLAAWGLALSLCWAQDSQHPDIVIGAENDAAPWSYADGTGFVNDLVRAAFHASGWNVQYDVVPYARCKTLVASGNLIACFSSSQTPETEKEMRFPKQAVFAAANRLYVKTHSTLNGCTPAQWGRKISVSVVREYEYAPAVDALLASGDVKVEAVVSERAQLRMLDANRFDAAIITTDPIKTIGYMAKIANVPARYKVICDYGAMPAYLGFSRKHPQAEAALAAFESGMETLKKEGSLKKLQKEWAVRALQTATTAPPLTPGSFSPP